MAEPKRKMRSIDEYVGKRLRCGRILRGVSQDKLARTLSMPISFQQLQKYEWGINRIAVSRLIDFAEVLNLPVAYFLPPGEKEMNFPLAVDEQILLESYRGLSGHVQKALITLLKTR